MSKKDDLPDSWVPTELRPDELKPRERVVYACGCRTGVASFGMFHGPFPTLEEALNVVPAEEDKNPVIVRFNKDGTDEVIYYWFVGRDGSKMWKRCKGK